MTTMETVDYEDHELEDERSETVPDNSSDAQSNSSGKSGSESDSGSSSDDNTSSSSESAEEGRGGEEEEEEEGGGGGGGDLSPEKSESEESEGEESEGEKSDAASNSSVHTPCENDDESTSRMTQVNFDESDTQDSRTGRTKSKQLKQQWDLQPELYGIRRSGRQRKEPMRLQAGVGSGSDDDQPKRRKGRQRQESEDWNSNGKSDEESEDDYRPSKRVARRSQPVRVPHKGRSATSKPKPSSKRRKHSSYESDGSSDEADQRSRHHSRRQTTAKVRSKSRSSRRKGTKRVSYKEVSENDQTDSDDLIEQSYEDMLKDEEELNRETIERILDHRKGKKGDIGNRTASYNCANSGEVKREEKPPSPKPEVKEEADDVELEVQYYVKWKNWAHIHNTWETEASLKAQKVNGIRKLENYKQIEAERQARLSHSHNRDEIEYEMLGREFERDLQQQFCELERVIAKMAPKSESAVQDYLCKWNCLPYSECTWEDGNLIKAWYPKQVENFLARQAAPTIPSKSGKAVKYRPKFVPAKKQPEYIGGGNTELKLRDYQLEGVNWLVASWTKRNSVILADEMGLGKTIQIISFLSMLGNEHQVYGPFLLVVPLSTVVAWQREFEKWAPAMNVVIYIGDIKSRNMIRDYEWVQYGTKRLKFNVVVTTYEILLKDKSFLGSTEWVVLGVDEAHRLKNDDSLLYKSLQEFKTSHRILITGTPLQNSLKELWSLLHFIMPEKFDSWIEFQERHERMDAFGNREVYKDLHKELEQFLIRRVKKDVEKSLPAKVEQILRVEMSSIQKTYYKWIVTKNFKALSKGAKGSSSSFLNIVMELKKCCNHSLLIKEPENANPYEDRLHALIRGSGKLILLDKLLCRLKETGHRVLIFSQMVMMLDILAEYLSLRQFQYQRLDGSVKSEIRKQALDHFNADGSQDFCFLLSTRAGGLGVNLATADTVIIFDSDWNPQNDLQAQARAHRIGQKNQVSVYRLVTKSSVEEDIVERAKKKMVLDHLVIQRMDTTGRTVLNKTGPSSSNPFNKEELASILKFGAEQLFKEEDEEDPQVDIDEVLKMAETHNTDAATPGNELLSNFKVVSFDNMEEEEVPETNTNHNDNEPSWDDIIPEAFRAKVEAEQTEEELKKMYLGPRKRKTVHQLNGEYDSGNDRHKKKDDHEGDDEDEEEEGSHADSTEDKPRKRGRPRTRDKIKGFTDAEVRRFVKSFKKFGCPLARLDAIACDAELQEKSEGDLKRLAEQLINECKKAMEDYKTKIEQDPSYEEKKTHRGPTFKLSNVMINAQAVTKANHDLELLAKEIPADEAARNRYRLQCRIKVVHWDKQWDIEDDSNLLKGVYMYGMGSWESIKMDPTLKLSEKILPDEVNAKPQGKHLQTRTEYLLKILAKQHEIGVPTPSSGRGKKRKPKSKAEVIEKENFSSDDNATRDETMDSVEVLHQSKKEVEPSNGSMSLTEGESLLGPPEPKPVKQKKKKKKKAHPSDAKVKAKEDEGDDEEENQKSVEKEHKENSTEKKSKSKKKEKKDEGPMHFTASAEPHVVLPDDLPMPVYNWCKAAMKPLKKQLRKMSELSAKQRRDAAESELYRNILLKIGRHISHLISEFTDVAVIQEKRGYLWKFCAIFTPGTKYRKLHLLYKKYQERLQDEARLASVAAEASHSNFSSGSHLRPDNQAKKRPHPPDKPGEGKERERAPKKHKADQEKTNESSSSASKHKHGSSGSSWSKGMPHAQEGGQKHQAASKRPWGQQQRAESSSSALNPNLANWTQASPLARTEDLNKDRYSSSGAYSSWYDSHRQSHSSEHKSDAYHRYNNDRSGGSHSYGRDHNRSMGSYHGENRMGNDRMGNDRMGNDRMGNDHHRGSDHRGADHHRPSGFDHHQRPEHSSYHSRPTEERGPGGYHSRMHRDRKRWGEDHGDSSDRRSYKDPRLERRSPQTADHRSPFEQRTAVPPLAGAATHH